jgi:hypothetical protein
MQIVKIYPKSKTKCHFSIRQNYNKYYVFEGDKVLRSDLKSIPEADQEIELIVRTRRENKLFDVPVNYLSEKQLIEDSYVIPTPTIDVTTVSRKNCKKCNNEFLYDNTKRGASRKLFCSKNCCTKFNNEKRYKYVANPKVSTLDTDTENEYPFKRKCKGCKTLFTPKRIDSFNCSQKCSQITYNAKIRKQKIKDSKKLADLNKVIQNSNIIVENIKNEGGSFDIGVGIRDVTDPFNTAEPIVRDYVLNDYPLEVDNEVINEFHDLTEKQMSLTKRTKHVNFLATDIVDYIFLWCEINEKLGKPQKVFDFFCDLERLNFIDLSKIDIIKLMPELLNYNSEGTAYIQISNFNFNDDFAKILIKEKLKRAIFEDVIPSEDQIKRGLVLKPLISQLLFTNTILKNQDKAQSEKIKEEIKPVNKFRVIDIREQFEEEEKRQKDLGSVINVLDTLTQQNNFLAEKVNQCLDISTKTKVDITKQLKEMAERIEKITQKRKGIFG